MPSLRIPRRAFLHTTGTAIAGAGLTNLLGQPASDAPASKPGFTHRGLNGWITDLATQPDPQASWPSMRLDERLLGDYRTTFALMRRLGFNEIVVWGLYVANRWPVNIRSAVPSERGQLVERLVSDAHEQGVKVLSGLGTYSWGFADIIRANPKLKGTNSNAMCPSQPESHEWMRRVVDFVFERFDIDGVSMQSADQGRCQCAQCAPQSSAEYHAALIRRVTEYIRSRWPKKTVGMSNWGLPFNNRSDQPALAAMSRGLDYMIDQNNSAQWSGREYRREFLRELACACGTTGGPVVEPPQHWERNRWFLPTCRRVHDHLQKLSQDGGRACEFFYHILANPSSELTFHVAGRALSNPSAPLEKLLSETVEELYQPQDVASRDGLARLFLDAEEAYFRHWPGEHCGTISLEPLVNDQPGPPIYLRNRLKAEQRAAYGQDLERLTREFEKLRPSLRSNLRAERIAACLAHVQKDLQ